MRRRKFYLHVGPMKTGTTAIQSALRTLDGSLLTYPGKHLYAGAHHKLVFNFFGDIRARTAGVVEVGELLAEIRSLVERNERDLVISSEALTPMAWQSYKTDPAALIGAILPCFGSTPPDVEILIACREHFSWAASTYSQTLKGSETWVPDEFLSTHAQHLRFAPMIRKLKQTGYPVTVLNYHPSQSWVERFLLHIGIPAQLVPRAQSVNVSLNPAGLIMKLAANRALRGQDTSRTLRRKLKKMPEFGAPSQFIFGAEAAKAADCYFSEDRDILANSFGIDFPVPDLQGPCKFFVTAQDLEMIETVARNLGLDSQAISDAARPFLRH